MRNNIEIKSILEKFTTEVNNLNQDILEVTSKRIIDAVKESRVGEEDKRKIILILSSQTEIDSFQRAFFNLLLAYEGLRVYKIKV